MPRAEPASVSFLEGAKVNDFTVNNIGRDAAFTNNYGPVKYSSFATLRYSHGPYHQSQFIEKLPRVEASYDDYACPDSTYI